VCSAAYSVLQHWITDRSKNKLWTVGGQWDAGTSFGSEVAELEHAENRIHIKAVIKKMHSRRE
jgi:hypothetical protein